MRLPKPFYHLPLRFDVERLRTEVSALPASAWAKHPNEIRGNTSLRLISVDGGENDDVNGVMRMTPHLIASPYIRQILGGLGVVWSRSRLLRLAPGASVPEHADINYHWYTRVRLHIPIITRPEVRFYCGDESVHMAAGEAWIFDNWRLHRVENPTEYERIHLVADTSGSSAFWRLAAQSEAGAPVHVAFSTAREWTPLTERTQLPPVMPPAEIDVLTQDLSAELVTNDGSPETEARRLRYLAMLDALRRDWRQLYALHADAPGGWAEFGKLRDSVRETSRALSAGLAMRTNRVGVHAVLEGRLLRAMLTAQIDPASAPRAHRTKAPEHPVFIVSAPRSGSTLLFETLAASSQICTLGGEAHWLVEGLAHLRPDIEGGVDSNRLTEAHATSEVATQVTETIASRLRDHTGAVIPSSDGRVFLEKTPKNSLRIPFFNEIFPDARFIFLWRDPRANIGSIIDAWRDGRWRTYERLTGFNGSWSLLLPPGYQAMNGRPLEEIAAWQWCETNRIVLDDLSALPARRWSCVRYADLVRAPRETVERLCSFLGIALDDSLQARLDAALPLSRYTLSAPEPDKWRRHEAAIERVITSTGPLVQRLRALH